MPTTAAATRRLPVDIGNDLSHFRHRHRRGNAGGGYLERGWRSVRCARRHRWREERPCCAHGGQDNRRSAGVEPGAAWKSYQESLPLGAIFGVNYSNGTATNLSDFSKLAPLTSSNVVQLYAVKHNPFAYFRDVQEGYHDNNSLANVVGFDGPRGLYADLADGHVPNLAFIAPNQCDDQHGRGNGDAFCAFDYGLNDSGYTYGTQVGLNPGLIQQGDTTIQTPGRGDPCVSGVAVGTQCDRDRLGRKRLQRQHDSALWIVSAAESKPGRSHCRDQLPPSARYPERGYYNSFSLLKSLEAGLGLPCLNHACDSNVHVMSDLFGGMTD